MDLSDFARHPFLKTLDAAQRERLLPLAREAGYERDAFVFREGGDADTLFLLRSGRVALEQHLPGQGVLQLESLGGGDLLGLSWLFSSQRWTLDARCVEPVQAYALRADGVRALVRDDPVLGVALLGHVVEALYRRLMRVRLQRLDVYRSGG